MLIARPTAIASALFAGLIGVHAQAPQERTHVRCDFTTSAQGWVISGDTRPAEPVFHPSGGSPGGHISHADEALGETWYFRAPDSVLRQLAAAENGTLSYSLKQSIGDPGFLDDDVIIVGPAGRLSFRFGTSPGTEWTQFSVNLTAAAGWRWNWNARASQEQIHSVLANPTSLEIRGEYHTGPDEGALDSVVLSSGERLPDTVRRDAMGAFHYRIHSPVILIEFDHQRPVGTRHLLDPSQPTRQHIHAVVRTPNGNDYGKDLLRQPH